MQSKPRKKFVRFSSGPPPPPLEVAHSFLVKKGSQGRGNLRKKFSPSLLKVAKVEYFIIAGFNSHFNFEILSFSKKKIIFN
jgi:hypothetical protein